MTSGSGMLPVAQDSTIRVGQTHYQGQWPSFDFLGPETLLWQGRRHRQKRKSIDRLASMTVPLDGTFDLDIADTSLARRATRSTVPLKQSHLEDRLEYSQRV